MCYQSEIMMCPVWYETSICSGFWLLILFFLPRWSRGRKSDCWARCPGFDSRVGQSALGLSIRNFLMSPQNLDLYPVDGIQLVPYKMELKNITGEMWCTILVHLWLTLCGLQAWCYVCFIFIWDMSFIVCRAFHKHNT